MFGKKNKQVNNTPPQVNASDNTYSDYYDNTPQQQMPINTNNQNYANTQVYNSEANQKNKTKNFKDPNSPNSPKNKFFKLILFLLGLLAVILFFYSFLDSKFGEHEIKYNLTSVGLLKTQGLTTSYQIDYLILPSTAKVPKFRIENEEIITFNKTTSYITSASLGETTIDILDVNDNKTVKNTMKVYVVDKRIKIEDFIVGDMTIKEGQLDMITISPSPENTTEVNFTYRSSDPEIVKVNNDGIVQGLKKGTVQIAIINNKIVKYIDVTVI